MPGKESLPRWISFASNILDISGHYTSVHILCFPPSFCTCSGQIVSITKSKEDELLVTDPTLQALILASHAQWVGFAFLSIYPCCALEDAPGQLTGACLCPEGHEVLAHFSAPRRHGPGQPKCCTPCLHN